MKTSEFKTTWGTITLTLNGDQVVQCALPLLNTTPCKKFKAQFSNDWNSAGDFFKTLKETFPRFGPSEGTEFQKAVWTEMQKIPRGQTRTYGEIAAAICRPKAVRAVGSACGANPIPLFIPCHRVVAKNGLGGFGSGLPWKKLFLELEGWNKGTVE
jgi:O-6-methylguanine DNA methyltransferase